MNRLPLILSLVLALFACSPEPSSFEIDNLYPWCIVAYDSLERSPEERIEMMKEVGFSKYAYDWRDHHLEDTERELKLAEANDIEIISVWLWLNAKRDSVTALSPANQRFIDILRDTKIETTVWLGFSPNYFKGKSQEESVEIAKEMIRAVADELEGTQCKIALYNHRGWFGYPYNQVEIIKELPELDLRMVYNFHHAHEYLKEFPEIVKVIRPYLVAVNLNGMHTEAQKIMSIGEGDHEQQMIELLLNEGFNGPWGILGHVGERDVKEVLEENIEGLYSIPINN